MSKLDQLRAMSKVNLETHQQTSTQPTLVTDVIQQLTSDSPEVQQELEPIVEQIETFSEPSTEEPELQPVVEEQENEVVIVTEDEATDETITENTVSTSSENVEVEEPAKPIQKEKTTHKKSKKAKEAVSPKKTYTGREITVTLHLPEEVADYLFARAVKSKISTKQCFKDIMINELENGAPVEDTLAKSYRKTQHDTIKKSIQINEDLKADIKEAAVKYCMKYTPFMTYVIDKARLADNAK